MNTYKPILPDLEKEYARYVQACENENKEPKPFGRWLANEAQERINTDKIYRKQAD